VHLLVLTWGQVISDSLEEIEIAGAMMRRWIVWMSSVDSGWQRVIGHSL
jgi:hypothetical protein